MKKTAEPETAERRRRTAWNIGDPVYYVPDSERTHKLGYDPHHWTDAEGLLARFTDGGNALTLLDGTKVNPAWCFRSYSRLRAAINKAHAHYEAYCDDTKEGVLGFLAGAFFDLWSEDATLEYETAWGVKKDADDVRLALEIAYEAGRDQAAFPATEEAAKVQAWLSTLVAAAK